MLTTRLFQTTVCTQCDRLSKQQQLSFLLFYLAASGRLNHPQSFEFKNSCVPVGLLTGVPESYFHYCNYCRHITRHTVISQRGDRLLKQQCSSVYPLTGCSTFFSLCYSAFFAFSSLRSKHTGWAEKVSLLISAITLSTAGQFS